MRMKMLIGVLSIFAFATTGFAQSAQPGKPDPLTDEAKLIAEKILSADKAESDTAVQAIRKQLSGSINLALIESLRKSWVPALLKTNRYAEVDEFTQTTILARPDNLSSVEGLSQIRIQALRLQGKHLEALEAAKGLYNVCGMRQTPQAIQLVAQCLAAARPDDPGAARRFKLQQAAGAMPFAATSTHAATVSAGEVNVLSTIRIDPKPYEMAIADYPIKHGYQAMMALGNLLLLADKPDEALEAFAQACELARDDGQRAAAIEALGHAMRAHDGTVGRVNAWVLSAQQP